MLFHVSPTSADHQLNHKLGVYYPVPSKNILGSQVPKPTSLINFCLCIQFTFIFSSPYQMLPPFFSPDFLFYVGALNIGYIN